MSSFLLTIATDGGSTHTQRASAHTEVGHLRQRIAQALGVNVFTVSIVDARGKVLTRNSDTLAKCGIAGQQQLTVVMKADNIDNHVQSLIDDLRETETRGSLVTTLAASAFIAGRGENGDSGDRCCSVAGAPASGTNRRLRDVLEAEQRQRRQAVHTAMMARAWPRPRHEFKPRMCSHYSQSAREDCVECQRVFWDMEMNASMNEASGIAGALR